MSISPIGSLFFRGLIGDTLQAHLGWGSTDGRPLVVVAPTHGPFAYLREIAQLSPWVAKILDLDTSANPSWQDMFYQAVTLLRAAGVRDVVVWDSEEWFSSETQALLSSHFDSVCYLPMMKAGLYARVPQAWRFPHSVLAWRQKFLADHQIQSYITVHNREAAWARELSEKGCIRANSWMNDVRNYRLDPLVQACKEALPAEIKVVRMGDQNAQPCHDPSILDTTRMGLSLAQQFALHQSALFFVGCNSGVGNIAHAMRRPILYINTTQPFTALRFPDLPTLNLGKRVFLQGKSATYAQIELFHGGTGPGRLVDGLGYEFAENSVQELKLALQKMQALLDQKASDDLYLDETGCWLDETQMAEKLTGEKIPAKDPILVKKLLAYQTVLSRLTARDFRMNRSHPLRLGIFGCGSGGQQQIRFFKSQRPDWVLHLYDNDERKWGHHFEGIEIRPGHSLRRDHLDFLIIATSVDQGSIGQHLERIGWIPGQDFVYYHKAQEVGISVETHRLSPETCALCRNDPRFEELIKN